MWVSRDFNAVSNADGAISTAWLYRVDKISTLYGNASVCSRVIILRCYVDVERAHCIFNDLEVVWRIRKIQT